MLFLTQEIGQRLLERLTFIKMSPLILLNLGDSRGTFTPLLQTQYPTATIINNNINIKTQSIDCIFSNCAFPWGSDLPSVLKEIKRMLKPEGVFLFSSFGPDTLKELRENIQKIDPHTPVNPFVDMHDIGDELIKLNFLDPVLDLEYITVEYPHVQDLLNDLTKSSIYPFLPTLHSMQIPAFIQEYETYRTSSGILPATFEIIYGLAWNTQDIIQEDLAPSLNKHIPIKIIP